MYTKSFSLSITPSLISRDSSSCVASALSAVVDVSLTHRFSELFDAVANVIYRIISKIPHQLLLEEGTSMLCWIQFLMICFIHSFTFIIVMEIETTHDLCSYQSQPGSVHGGITPTLHVERTLPLLFVFVLQI